eukprot:SAG11_NODE_10126_length_853_cov_0.942971_1_plen_100_part_00
MASSRPVPRALWVAAGQGNAATVAECIEAGDDVNAQETNVRMHRNLSILVICFGALPIIVIASLEMPPRSGSNCVYAGVRGVAKVQGHGALFRSAEQSH